MKSALRITFWVGLFFFSFYNSFAQSERHLDSIESITHSTYDYKNGKAILSVLKKSIYDTTQILIRQNRYNYIEVDTGLAVVVHYSFTYNPKNRYGSYTTKTLPHTSQPARKLSEQLTEFRSYDHDHKREWVKIYKKDSKNLLRHIEQSFDANGNPILTKTHNHETNPPNTSTEKVQRNTAGNITFWESFDDDGDTKMQARSFSAEYKNDTILLSSSGYLYNNWNEVKNSYNSKGELTKSISNIGTRQSNGKTKITDQTTITYTNNKPSKSITKNLNKVVETIDFIYEAGKEIQQITTPEKTYQEIKTFSYLDSTSTLLTNHSETLQGKPFKKTELQSDTLNQLVQHTEIEYRENGKDWKTVKEYNSLGNLTTVRFYIDNILNKEDVYEYVYFPAMLKED